MPSEKESFDKFLLDHAVDLGAVHKPVRIDDIAYRGGRPVLYSGNEDIASADLAVGALGINSSSISMFEKMGFGYRPPNAVKAAIAELVFDETTIREHFGNAIHLFLLPVKGIKFAAMIPKGNYVTVCVLGKDMEKDTIPAFLDLDVVKRALPVDSKYEIQCRCLPRMNTGAPGAGYADRVVLCGDAGSTRLFKDGLGAAYTMGKAAATCSLFQGVGKKDFEAFYKDVYDGIVTDNRYGRVLYAVTDVFRSSRFLTRAMVAVVDREQKSERRTKRMSSILWDMFTGNERYYGVFKTALALPLQPELWSGFLRALTGRVT